MSDRSKEAHSGIMTMEDQMAADFEEFKKRKGYGNKKISDEKKNELLGEFWNEWMTQDQTN